MFVWIALKNLSKSVSVREAQGQPRQLREGEEEKSFSGVMGCPWPLTHPTYPVEVK